MTGKTFEGQYNKIEEELRNLENNPEVSKQQLRLFLQSTMFCGHAVGNLLTCDNPPFGCVICNDVMKKEHIKNTFEKDTSESFEEQFPSLKGKLVIL